MASNISSYENDIANELYEHIADIDHHVTVNEKAYWNDKLDMDVSGETLQFDKNADPGGDGGAANTDNQATLFVHDLSQNVVLGTEDVRVVYGDPIEDAEERIEMLIRYADDAINTFIAQYEDILTRADVATLAEALTYLQIQ